MKAENHIFFGFIFLIIYYLFGIFFFNYVLNLQLSFLFSFGGIVFLICFILYFIGLILPDSDVTNFNSTIFHSIFFAFGVLLKPIEFLISKFITKRKIGHRQSLHTITGISISSLFLSILVFILVLPFTKNFDLFILMLFFISLLISQYFHLVCDGLLLNFI
ncbi:MAG: hypothetical protein PHQ98_04445 [Candidatus ainarchaeum sp.]|nr:hypothetical protein [Candidatus ainarchaeum sp.]